MKFGQRIRILWRAGIPSRRRSKRFFESTSFEDAIRNAISIGGDSDTIAAITGGVAEAYYGVPQELREKAESYLDERLLRVIHAFENLFER